ncbi:MAG: ribosome biogenesis GTPase Der [Phycisphaeraceae bacterium]|nr:ribosome biogenesis GTPase Der [Phycisphaeraceae bacterium]
MTCRIAIVGRPNVGKSSLFNMLANRRVAIVDPTAGVTRDRLSITVELPPVYRGQEPMPVELIDTGGYGIEDSANLTADVERQIALAVASAHLVLFVIDAQTGVVPLDQDVAKLLRKSRAKAVMIVANKVDGEKLEADAQEAARLGFGPPAMVSAVTRHMKNAFLEAVRRKVSELDIKDDPAPQVAEAKIAIVGKRNAGKSTLVNALAGEDRVIVSEIEGTTRDAIDVRFEMDGRPFVAIDTAGVRKGKSIQDDIEYYSLHRSLLSVRRADVVLLLIDAAIPVSQVDRKLVNEILKHYKPTVIVVNKWDLAQGQATQEEYAEYLDKALKGLDFAPIVFISAKAGEGMRDLVKMAMNLYRQAGHRVGTSELNRVVKAILEERAPGAAKGGKRPKVYYVTQLAIHPPTIGLFVNDPDLFDATYQRFLMHRLRDALPYSEVPIQLLVRARKQSPRGENGEIMDAVEPQAETEPEWEPESPAKENDDSDDDNDNDLKSWLESEDEA